MAKSGRFRCVVATALVLIALSACRDAGDDGSSDSLPSPSSAVEAVPESSTTANPPGTSASTPPPTALTSAPTSTTVRAAGPDLVITTLHYDAAGNDNQNKNDEWVEIENRGGSPADLTGWRIEDEGPNHVYAFPHGFVLEAGMAVQVFTGCGTDTAIELYWCSSGSAVWNNDGDVATLFDSAGGLVDSWSY